MSLYIGKDNSSNSILHITSNTHNITDLKSSVQDDTVFHSSLPYIQPLKFTCTFSSSTYTAQYPFGVRKRFYITPNIDAINLIMAGYEYMINVLTTNSNGKYVKLSNHVEIGGWSSNKDIDSSLMWGPTSSFNFKTIGITEIPTQLNKTLMMENQSSVSILNGTLKLPYNILNKSDTILGCYILILNVKNNVIVPQINAPTSSETSIYLDSSTFIINSGGYKVDMNKFTYLRRVKSELNTDNYFQSINTGNKPFYFYTDQDNAFGWKIFNDGYSYAVHKKLSPSSYKPMFSSSEPISIYKGIYTSSILKNTTVNSQVEYNIFNTELNTFYIVDISCPSIKTYGHKGSLETNFKFNVRNSIVSSDDNSYGIIYVSEHLSIYNGEMSPRDSIIFIWAGVINNVFKIKINFKLGGAAYNSSHIHKRVIQSINISYTKYYTNSIV